MAEIHVQGSDLLVETDLLQATVHTEGYVSGVGAGTLLDKTTGARDLGFGLNIADFLLEPLPDTPEAREPYHTGDLYHGNLVKRYVELPQICTQAGRLPYELLPSSGSEGAAPAGTCVGVRLRFRYREATYGRHPGSLWEQTLTFCDGRRYFLAQDRITSANDVEALIFRLDMPGHLKHQAGDSFDRVYLSYQTIGGKEPTTLLPAQAFVEDFPPDAGYLYRRGVCPLPERMIRAYRVRLGGEPGPWLAGMTLQPEAVYEAWCHQRGYVCFIEELGGGPVQAGDSFGASYAVGWFDSIAEMERVYDEERARLTACSRGT